MFRYLDVANSEIRKLREWTVGGAAVLTGARFGSCARQLIAPVPAAPVNAATCALMPRAFRPDAFTADELAAALTRLSRRTRRDDR